MAPTTISNPTPSQLLAFLPKLSDADADLRYMSLNDLYNTLNAGAPTFLANEYHTSAKIIDGVLQTLDDQNGEVQNQAIRCVSALVLKLPADILAPFVHRVSNIKTTNSVDTSIPATALRTFITAFQLPLPGLPPSSKTQDAYSAISRVLIPRLLGRIIIPHGLENLPAPPPGMLDLGSEKGANSDAVDVLVEVIRCFGPMLQEPEKQALQESIMTILDDERTGSIIKKKAVTAISLLAVSMSDRLLSGFVSTTSENLQSPQLTLAKRRLLITMVGSLSRTIPQRLGQHLKSLAPSILNALSAQEFEQSMRDFAEEGAPDPEIEEIREAALIALEGFLASCSNDMRPFTTDAIDAALRYVVYDPNTATDVDEDDEDMGGTQEDDDEDDGTNGYDEEEDFEEEGGLSDDDDSTWKVRRCAAKALYAIISTRSTGDLLDNGTLYDKVAPVLINRFREREENVRLEVLMTLGSLVRKTGEGVSPPGLGPDQEHELQTSLAHRSRKRRRVNSDAALFDPTGPFGSSMGLSSPAVSPSPLSGPKADLARLSPSIVRGLAKLMKQNSIATKQVAITLLRDVILVQSGGLSDSLSKIFDPLLEAVKSSSSSSSSASTSINGSAAATGGKMRMEALQLVTAICDTHSSKYLAPYLAALVPSVIVAIKDRYYKVASEACMTIESIIKVLTPPRSAGTEKERRIYLGQIHEALLFRAASTDADLEVRQRAILALGVLLARTSGPNNIKLLVAENRSKALAVLQDRLKNETTRISAVKAVDLIAASAKDQGDLPSPWIRQVTLELGAQLRKVDRSLRGASLNALRNLVSNAIALSSLDESTIHDLTALLLPLMNANDLNMLGLAMTILSKLVKQSPKKVVDSNLNKALCQVVLAPLGGAVFDAFLGLVQIIGDQAIGQPLMHGFLQDVGVSGDPAVVGKAIGTLLVSGGSTVGVSIDDFATELRSSKDYQRQCLALSVLGEAGLRLGSSSPLEPKIFTAHFNSKSDNVPRAAAIALGRAGAGNINTYLPVILTYSGKGGHLQYLSLHSIKEILQYASTVRSDISPYTKDIWKELLMASQAEDNKAIGAECIGRLTIIEPKLFLPQLQDYLRDQKHSVRGMTIQAIRATLTDSDDAFDEALRPLLVKMLTMMLIDSNIENRRLALSCLNASITHKSDIVLPHFASLIPLVMQESKVNSDLIREVQMGPFKHKVDDGLELRKSAYETLYSVMGSVYGRLNAADLFDRVIAGLEDEHDIKMLCLLMVTKLIALDPEETNRHLDALGDRLRVILSFKPKENSVKQEVEKASEASKAALKVSVRLNNIVPGASNVTNNVQGQQWKGYWEWLGKEFKSPLSAMEHEVKSQAA